MRFRRPKKLNVLIYNFYHVDNEHCRGWDGSSKTSRVYWSERRLRRGTETSVSTVEHYFFFDVCHHAMNNSYFRDVAIALRNQCESDATFALGKIDAEPITAMSFSKFTQCE